MMGKWKEGEGEEGEVCLSILRSRLVYIPKAVPSLHLPFRRFSVDMNFHRLRTGNVYKTDATLPVILA